MTKNLSLIPNEHRCFWPIDGLSGYIDRKICVIPSRKNLMLEPGCFIGYISRNLPAIPTRKYV